MTALVRPPAPVRPRATVVSVLTAILVAVLSATLLLPQPVVADPGEDDAPSIDTLRRKLDKATAAYNNAKGRLDTSKRKEKKLGREIKELEGDVAQLSSKVGEMAAAVYKGSRANTLAALLESGSPRELAQGMTTVEYLAHRDYEQIKEYVETRDRLAVKRYEVELELRKQRSEAKKMAKRKKDAQKALIEAGGGAATSGGPTAGAATADPAPRAPDGSWPPEACTQDDPTTDGCLTPRTRHAYDEAQRAGYKRHTSCYRQSSYGEHPKGRACDFAAFKGGFENQDAYGDSRQYGDNLAGWFIGNADRLGVMYIIWYRRIWYPGQGWSSYNGGGSPSGDHTNHVHVSIQ